MNAIEFPEQTLIIAKDQPQYSPLPAHVTPDGVVTFAFELTDGEIERLVETRTLWVRKLTFCQPLQPINIMVEKPTFEVPEEALPKCGLCGRVLD